MARFLGIVQGGRGEASRLGHAASGIRAQAQGWSVGVKIYGHATDGSRDIFDIYMTSGSGGGTSPKFLGRVTLGADGLPTFEPERGGVTRDGIPALSQVSAIEVEPEACDRLEALGEARALTGELGPSDDAYWFTLAQELLAPLPDK